MATLPYAVQTSDVNLWGTLVSTEENLEAQGVKRLNIALDPLIDPSVIAPAEAYDVTNT